MTTREGLHTIASLVIIAAGVYALSRWPEKTPEQRLDTEYYTFSSAGMSCVAHKKPYWLQCVAKMTGS